VGGSRFSGKGTRVLCFTAICKGFVPGAGEFEFFLFNISGIDYCILYVLKYSRRFHIFNTTTALDVWMRRVRLWKGLRNMGVETMVVRTKG